MFVLNFWTSALLRGEVPAARWFPGPESCRVGVGVGVFHYLLPTFQQHLEEEWGEGGGKSECEGEVKEEAVNRNTAEIS